MKINNSFAIFFLLAILTIGCIFSTSVFADNPQSATYELKSFEFGAGGTSGSDSTTFTLFGTAGDFATGKINSTNFQAQAGLIYTFQANIPPAPTFTNPGSNYDRLKIVINQGGNPSDSKYAVAISTDNFAADTKYIQSDFTVGPTLGSEDWVDYSTWGSASGVYVTGLAQNTTYTVKVKVKQGNFTEPNYSPTDDAVTSVPSLTFGIDSASIVFNNLNSGNSYTDSSKSTILTTSTNAYNGYIIYGWETSPLTYSSYNIPDYGSPNSSPTVWSGSGFGYTTDDSSLSGGTADRFTNGGPKYAGFGTSTPGDPVADHTSVILTPVINETFTTSYRVTASSTTTAGPYQTTVVYIIVPTY